ncbi:AAA family ATPase [Pseudactinotalea suaedae]|uniref:AAA family ATPase n=1 Tax=Pseudactinotalea suaedae TaxID=1524924 RepID=UPI0012E2453C|nr:AAA family ATPase [Pseudactinotalea suaedae]
MPDLLILVNGLPGAGKTTLAHQLGASVDAVVISKDAIKEAMADALRLDEQSAAALGAAAMEAAWVLAAAVARTVLVESWWFAPRDLEFVRAGIAAVSPDRVVEVWCDAGTATARSRYVARRRHAVHQDVERLERDWETWASQGRPLGLSPVVEVDTSGPVDVAGLAAEVSAAHA